MNIDRKTIAIGAGAFLVGAGTGYMVSVIRFSSYIKRQLAELEETYNDNLEQITKTGKYATPASAAAVLLTEDPSEIVLDERPVIVKIDDDASDDEEVYLEDDSPEAQAAAQEFNAKEFVKSFMEKGPETYGGVSFPGQVVDDDNLDAQQDDPVAKTTPDFTVVRDPAGPYLISIDDYMEDDSDSPFSKVEMTWFEGDSILVDSQGSQVPDVKSVIGTNNLDKWGTGTTDSDQVYIRNERLEIDIELTRDENTYLKAVLGIQNMEDQIENDRKRRLKMREDDDI